MEIRCDKCRVLLNIPDNKIDKGKKMQFSCPKCKGQIILDPNESKSDGPAFHNQMTESQGEHIKKSRKDKLEDDIPLDFYGEGVKLALILANDIRERKIIFQALEELGYQCIIAESTREAISKIKYHLFDAIILLDGFDGLDVEQSAILQWINNLSLSIRRRILLTLIGHKFKTMDKMSSYAFSVNLLININDMDNLTDIFRIAFTENNKFYKVFRETLEELGKA